MVLLNDTIKIDLLDNKLRMEKLLLNIIIFVLIGYILFGFFIFFTQKSMIYYPDDQNFNK